VLVTGGSEMEETAATAALDAELFDRVAGIWTVGARARVPRLYHSVALLLADGRVVTAGSNPARRTEELRMEVYWPPYLFRGSRPTLGVERTEVGYGESLVATVTGERPLRELSLVRPGATTHSTDNEQRLVDVAFTVGPGGGVTLGLPTSAALAPPGWYMLFAVDGAGVPSHAVWLHLIQRTPA
jgi:Domain of unknown function (DUF1929)